MEPGDLVGERFAIAELAGTGGMGRVYKATDRQTGAPVALKLLAASDAAANARFDHEARVLAALEHPRVVRYVAHGRAGAGELWLAMEWVEGETLADRLARATLRVEESLAMARGVAEALAAAHARGVVHRDIKPSNIILKGGDPARVKVLDFGIAHVLGATRALTRTGTVMGTPGYLAPEHVRGDRGSIDARADVFSLGAVLFECLAGRPAFEGTHVMALLAKLLLEEPPRLADVRPGVPPALDALVARMLAKEPSARPADGAAVLAALAKVGEAEGAGPGDPPAAQRAITTSEQRLLSVVVATRVLEAAPHTAPQAQAAEPRPADATAPDLWSTRMTAICAATAPLGARVERLADGTLLLVLAGSGSATDQAAQAARAALSLRAIVPGARVSLVTGRGEATGRLPVGEILERAARMLRPPGETSGERDRGDDRDDDADPAVRLDETTHALLDARFDVAVSGSARLLLGEREIGEAARTLLGRPTPCAGRDRELRHLRDHLAECFASEAEYAFRHALVRDGSYAMLTERDRALGHRLAAEWLLGAGEHDPKVIGEHFERGDEPRRAVAHYLRAAEQALLGNDNALLAALTEKGIRLGAEGDTAAAFHAIDAESAIYSFEVERGLAAGEAALRLASPGSPSACRALGSLVLIALFSQQLERFDAYLPRLLAINPTPEVVPMFSRGCTVGLTAVTVAGLRNASEACLRRLEQVTQGTSASDPHTSAFLCCSRAYWARFAEGDPWAALSLDLEGRAHFEAAGDARFFKYEHIQIGYDYLLLGDVERAEEALRVAVGGLQNDEALGPVAVVYLARARLLRGDLDEASALAAPIVAQGRFYKAYASGIVAGVHLARGEVDAAERALSKDDGSLLSTSIQAFWVLAVLVEIRLRQGRFAEALALADDGLARQAAVGMFWAYPRPELLCARAAALSALGEEEAARATWREARAEILARAGKIADPDLRRSFLENVQTNARILAEARAADS